MRKILIADDDFISLEVLKAMLSQHNLEIHTASDGAGAVEMATHIQPDLIILDYEMPKLTGAQACQQLRKQAAFKGTPIIALTGHQSPTELDACKVAGMNQTLLKPVSPDALQEVLDNFLPTADS